MSEIRCPHCNGTGKYKMPNNQEEFDRIVDWELDKAYMVSPSMAEDKAYKKVGLAFVDCPFCTPVTSQE